MALRKPLVLVSGLVKELPSGDTTDVGSQLTVPSFTTAGRDAISSPATGMVIWNSDTSELNFYDGAVWWGRDSANATVSLAATKIGMPGWQRAGQSLASTTFTGQRMFYMPFRVARTIGVTGLAFRTGATTANTPTYFFGIYKWGPSSNIPTTLLQSTSQAVAAATTYNLAVSVSLPPGNYAIGVLADKVGTQTLAMELWNQSLWNDFVLTGTTITNPLVYGGNSTGLTALPSPNSDTINPYYSWASGTSASENANSKLPCMLKWTEQP